MTSSISHVHRVRNPEDPRIDIYLVHGLNSDWEPLSSQTENSDYSLPNYLSRKFPSARVSTISYNSDTILDDVKLSEIALQVLEELRAARESSNATGGFLNIPISFIGHNIGGIVIQKILYIANRQPEYLKIAAYTRLLILFGTPIEGHPWNNVIFNIALASTKEEPFKSRRHEIMSRVISLGSFAMSNTSKCYSPFTYQYDTMRIFEDKPMDVFGIVVPCYPPKEEITEGHGTYVRDKEHNCLTDFSTTPLEDKVLSTMLTKLDKLQRFQQHDGLNEYLRLRLCVSTLYARIDVKTAPSYHQEILLLATDFLQSIVEENDIIHIRGQSGTGKSLFARQFPNQFNAMNIAKEYSLFAFEFSELDCRRKTANHFLLSFLHHLYLTRKDKSIFEDNKFTENIHFKTIIQHLAARESPSFDDLFSLCRIILHSSKRPSPYIFLIDSISECDGSAGCLLERLLSLNHSKVIITSRGDKDSDINACREQCYTIQFDQALPGIAREKEVLLERRQTNIDGDTYTTLGRLDATTLQLQLLLDILNSYSSESLRAIPSEDIPLNLEYNALYGDLLRHLLPSEEPNRMSYMRVLAFVAFAFRPLTVEELSEILAVDSGRGIPFLCGMEHPIINKMNSARWARFIRIDDGYVHLPHISVKNFILQNIHMFSEQDALARHFCKADMHGQYASICLEYLGSDGIWDNQPSTPIPTCCEGEPILRKPLSRPFMDYAVLYWASHSRNSPAHQQSPTVETLLQNHSKLGLWLERYLFLKDSTNIKDCLPGYVSSQLDEFSEPMDSLKSPINIYAYLGFSEMVGKVLIDASLDAKLEALRWSIDEDHFSTVETVLRTSELNPRLWASALLRSCELGRINIVQLVLHVLGADKHQLPLDHCLCTAVKNGHREVVFHLIEANANVNTIDRPHNLLDHLDEDTESTGRTPLILAAEHGYGNIIIVLLKLGADPDVITDCDRLALKEAAQNGHLLAVKLLLGSGKCRVDARAKDSTPTALHLAAEMGHVEVVQTLLEAGADANLTYQAGWTPLYYACQNEHVEIIKALIEYGANTLVQDRWNVTPLSYACSHGLSHAVLALLENNVDPNFPIDYSGASKIRPIHFAAENGYHQIVEYLLKFGADSTKSLAKTKETPLLLALKRYRQSRSSDYLRTMELLIENGADRDRHLWIGQYPVHIALRYGEIDVTVLELLLNVIEAREPVLYKVDVNAQDKLGRTALHLAAASGNEPVVKALMKVLKPQLLEAEDWVKRRPCDVAKTHDIRTILLPPKRNIDAGEYLTGAVRAGGGTLCYDWEESCCICSKSLIRLKSFYHCEACCTEAGMFCSPDHKHNYFCPRCSSENPCRESEDHDRVPMYMHADIFSAGEIWRDYINRKSQELSERTTEQQLDVEDDIDIDVDSDVMSTSPMDLE